MGHRVEPGADRGPRTHRFPDDAHLPRGDLSDALHSGPLRPAARAGRLPPYRAGVAGSSCSISAAPQRFCSDEVMISARPAEADYVLSLGTYGRGSDSRVEPFGDRHTCRAQHPVHHGATPAPGRRARQHAPGQEWSRPGRLRRHAVRDAIASQMTTLPDQLCRSLIWGRGKEMA